VEDDGTFEAYTIEIKYYFDANGVDYVTVVPNEGMSAALLLGILDLAKFHVRYPPEELED
jgi:hypothetical protein